MKLTTLATLTATLLSVSTLAAPSGSSPSNTIEPRDSTADDLLVTSKWQRHASTPPSASALEERGRKKHHSRKKTISGGKITFYSGSQLLNPACPGQATPTDDSFTAAVSILGGPAKCGDRVQIRKGDRSVVVTVVDYCAACNPKWIDVTKGVFKQFDDLATGEINDMTFTVL